MKGPNSYLIGCDLTIQPLDTPALIVDLDRLESNLATAAGLQGIRLWPHAKAHKCLEIARRQIAAGAAGISVASVIEAERFAVEGIPRILVTSPIVSAHKIERLCHLARSGVEIICAVNSIENAEAISSRARAIGQTLGAVIDLDIGMGRTGVRRAEDAVALARHIVNTDGLRFRGVQGYSGLIQHIRSYEERAAVYGEHVARLRAVIERLTAEGFTTELVTGGGTGSLGVDRALQVITDCQIGSYVFMDRQYAAVQLAPEDQGIKFQHALFVRTTIIDRSADDRATCDAGTKALALDTPLPVPVVRPDVQYSHFGDEHGQLRGPDLPPVGAWLDLIPAHCDPVVNLHDYLHVVRGNILVDIWPVDARGTL